jgi:hypothetical protein
MTNYRVYHAHYNFKQNTLIEDRSEAWYRETTEDKFRNI